MSSTEESEIKTVTVSGHGIEIDETRSVFVGHAEGDDTFYIRFVNAEESTRLRLSPEAAKALHALLDDAFGTRQTLLKWILHAKEAGNFKDADWRPA